MNSLNEILNYHRKKYPHATFDLLTVENLDKFVLHGPFSDVLLSTIKEEGVAIFKPYLENLEYHYKAGRVKKGTLMINAFDNLEGEVIQKDKRVKVKGKLINRAMHGDEVYIKDNEIVGIYKSKTRMAVGTLISIYDTGKFRIGMVRPIDRRLPDIKIYTHLSQDSLFKKIVVHIISWENNSENPLGIVFKILGESGNFEDEINAIFEHHHIEYAKETWIDTCNKIRSKEAESYLPIIKNSKTPDKNITPEDLLFDRFHFSVERALNEVAAGSRKDLRSFEICSIDPVGCQDIDDALHCVKYDNYIEVGVHIADVSFYVHPGSILDIAAQKRSTTVYFPDRRIDMLPAFLSADLCSLLEGKERAAFSCIMKFDLSFNLIDTEICRSLIKSRAALSYQRAFEIIESQKQYPLQESLRLLLEIATNLRKRRIEGGALELNTHEVCINKKGEIKVKEHVPTHYLVEEFMLMANITVANFIYKHNPEYSLLRMHPLPSSIELDVVDATNSKTLNDSLKRFDEEQATILKKVITRSMQQALYFCSGEASDFYHYGLATDIYTHFTSPIRRYPDIIVHRTLSYILEGKEAMLDGLNEYVNQRSCSWMNFRHRNAQSASRMVEELFKLRALEQDIHQASVVAVNDKGIIVFIKKYGIEGFISTEKKFKLFDKLNVHVSRNLEEYCLNRTLQITIQENA
ncbi:exosome catalytic subunit dis3 [Glugoides intestinalis]